MNIQLAITSYEQLQVLCDAMEQHNQNANYINEDGEEVEASDTAKELENSLNQMKIRLFEV